MSYSIYYKAQFIKVDENSVIPYVEAGDNNVWEMDNKKRAREWTNIRFKDTGFITTNEALITAIDNMRTSAMQRAEDNTKQYGAGWEYSDKAFGYHEAIAIYGKSTHNTTFAAFKSIFTNGIAQAMTIEEFKERRIMFHVYVSPYFREELAAAGKEVLPTVYITSTEHLIATIAEFDAYYKGVANYYIKHSGWIENIIDERKRTKRNNRIVSSKTKVAIVVDEYWVLADPDEKYFVKGTKYGYKYTFMKHDNRVKAFMTEKQANSFIEKNNHKTFKPIKVEAKKIFWKPAKMVK